MSENKERTYTMSEITETAKRICDLLETNEQNAFIAAGIATLEAELTEPEMWEMDDETKGKAINDVFSGVCRDLGIVEVTMKLKKPKPSPIMGCAVIDIGKTSPEEAARAILDMIQQAQENEKSNDQD